MYQTPTHYLCVKERGSSRGRKISSLPQLVCLFVQGKSREAAHHGSQHLCATPVLLRRESSSPAS